MTKETVGDFLNKNIKLIAGIMCGIVALLGIVIAVVLFAKNNSSVNDHTIVYRKGSEIIVRIEGKEVAIKDGEASNFKCDKENSRVFYTVNSASSQELFDLYYVEKKKGSISEPRLIDYGVESDYQIVSGNAFYLRYNKQNKTDDGCFCSIADNKIETFSENAESIVALSGSNEIFFTKMHSDSRVLYRYSSDSPKEVSRDVTSVNCYNDTENPHIIFEKKSAAGMNQSEVYIVYAEKEPELICDNAVSVMLDEYVPGGNLYFFTSGEENISWTYVIADEYAESDETITKPKRTDFFSFFGISREYNEKLREYEDKLVRDEIRDALNESMETGAFNAPIFIAYAYNSEGVHKVVENVDPSRVYSVSVSGAPKIVFESSKVIPAETDMAALVAVAQRSTMDEVIEYAKTVVNESVVSAGMALGVAGADKCESYPLDEYEKGSTLFSFSSDGNRLFAFVKSSQSERFNLYTNTLDENLKPSPEVTVDTGVSSYKFIDDSIVYLKNDVGKGTGDIYSYNGKSTKLSNNAGAFNIDNENNILIFKNYSSSSSPTVDLYIYEDGEEKLICKKVTESSYAFDENGEGIYISTDDGANKSLCFYGGGKAKEISDNVSEIILFK